MVDSFGARLRERREQQQISLGTIAEQTKIKLSLLEALERGDVSHWPSGIFRRAFIRAYAHAIGLEPDVVVREFLELYPDPAEIVEPIPALAAALDGPGHGGAPTRLRFLVTSAVETIARRRMRQPSDAPAAREPQLPVARVEPVVAEAHRPIQLQRAEAPSPAPAPPPLQQDRPEEQRTAEPITAPSGPAQSIATASAPIHAFPIQAVPIQAVPTPPVTTAPVTEALVAPPSAGEEQLNALPPERSERVLTPQPSSAERPMAVPEPRADTVNLSAVAELCTGLGQVSMPDQLAPLL